MAAKVGVLVFAGRQDGVLDVVFSWAKELDVVAIVGAVVGHHGHELTLHLLCGSGFGDLKLDHQVGHPGTFFEAVGVAGQGFDVGLDVNVRFFCLAHHAVGLHDDRLQVNRSDLHAKSLLRRADGVFEGLGSHCTG